MKLSKKNFSEFDGFSKDELVENFIRDNIEVSSDYDSNQKSLNRLVNFFCEIDFVPEEDFYLKLVKNSKLSNLLANIMTHKYVMVSNDSFSNDFSDGIKLSIFEAYCLVNNIKRDFGSDGMDEDVYINDSIRQYLQEIDFPLLTREEEYELAVRVKSNDLQARREFIERNLKLVVSVAKKFMGKGLPLLDLVQEGNIGLITAVYRFEPTLGYKFSTYAIWWIRQAIMKALYEQVGMIRIPTYLYDKIGRYNLAKKRLEEKLKREPTSEEIARYLDVSLDVILEIEKLPTNVVSINNLVDQDDDTEFEFFISDSEDSVIDGAVKLDMAHQVKELLESSDLKPREKEILCMRYGFYNNVPYTLEEIGKMYGLTRQRVQQIEAQSLKKLRKSKEIEEFAVYTDNEELALENIEMFRQKYQESKSRTKTYLPKPTKSKRNKVPKYKKKNMSNIYDYFSDYTYEEVNEMLAQLPDNHLEIIYKKYGKDLKNAKSFDNSGLSDFEKRYFYGNVRLKMISILDNIRRGNQNVLDDERKYLDQVIVALNMGLIDSKQFSVKEIAEIIDMDEKNVLKILKEKLVLYKDDLEKLKVDLNVEECCRKILQKKCSKNKS